MTQFAKGQSGNPGGKAKKKIRATINGVEGDYTETEIFAPAMTRAAAIFLKVLEEGSDAPLDMQLRAAEYVTNRVFGKARQAVELTGEDGEAIKHEVSSGDEAILALVADLARSAGPSSPGDGAK